MTIKELAREYDRSAALLRGRIRLLEQARKETHSEDDRARLDGRLRPLRAMYRDTRAVTRHLERYDRRFATGKKETRP